MKKHQCIFLYIFIKYQPRDTSPLLGTSAPFFSHVTAPGSQDEAQDVPLYLCSCTLVSAGKTHGFMGCPGAMRYAKLVPGWMPEEPGPQEALQHALSYRLHAASLLLFKVSLYYKDSRQCIVLKNACNAWHLDLRLKNPYPVTSGYTP